MHSFYTPNNHLLVMSFADCPMIEMAVVFSCVDTSVKASSSSSLTLYSKKQETCIVGITTFLFFSKRLRSP